MAERRQQVTARVVIALLALGVLAGALPILWLAARGSAPLFDSYTLRVLTFTVWQAFLSTVLSLALAIPASLALVRRKFTGRGPLVSLLALPLALPQIVVVLGLVSLFGEDGWLGGVLPLYGLSGILIAQVFFNATLAARLCLQSLHAIPAEQLRLAAQLNLTDWKHFKTVDWPVLARTLPGLALLIFLLCAASFTIVLTLGGGPQATTLEAAIYQSLRADFDPARAAGLALIQLALSLVLGLAILRSGLAPTQTALRLVAKRFDGTSLQARISDSVFIIALALLLLLPLAALIANGVPALTAAPLQWHAVATSLIFATLTAAVTLTLSFSLASATARSTRFAKLAQFASFAGLALPPAVVATGWFLIAINTIGVSPVAPVLIITLNAMLALPYAFSTLLPAFHGIAQQDRLAASLNLSGWRRFWTADRRALQPAMFSAFAMVTVLALGDLAAILFFGDGRYVTLPSLIYQQMGSYRMQGAMGTAFALATLASLILFAAERMARRA